MNRKLQNSLISGAIAMMAGFSVTSFMWHSLDWMKNHRAIATASAGVGILTFAGSKFALDRREVPQILIKEAIATELLIRLSDSTLKQDERDALQTSLAVFQYDCTILREQSRVHITTLNQLL